MKIIRLSKGAETTVDDDDYLALMPWRWQLSSRGYAIRSAVIDGRRRTLQMHRVVINCPADLFVDHINGDKLDNRRSNLRFATKAENTRNQMRTPSQAGFKGVSRNSRAGTYKAQIKVDRKTIYLGTFNSATAAAQAYNNAAVDLHGEFANLNPS